MRIEKDTSLKHLNTFGVECQAERLIRIESVDDLLNLYKDKTLLSSNQIILGGGSNVLFTRQLVEQVVLIDIPGIEIEEKGGEHALLRAGAGEIWDNLVSFSLKNNLSGIENLSIIPGKAGAAPIQNIGAYGVELSEVFESLTAFHITEGKLITFSNEECKFGYRNSFFKSEGKGKYIICEIRLRLNKKPSLNLSYGALRKLREESRNEDVTPEMVREEVIKIRNSKLPNPAEIGNAGSFFKNPIIDNEAFSLIQDKYPEAPGYESGEGETKVPAGWLIETCGWKGKVIGSVGVHEKQALVLVNHGGASGKEIYDLAMSIQSSVLNEFGIVLEPEVNII